MASLVISSNAFVAQYNGKCQGSLYRFFAHQHSIKRWDVTSVLGKARATAACFPIATSMAESTVVSRLGRSGENDRCADIFNDFAIW